jgi:hypothetical protein
MLDKDFEFDVSDEVLLKVSPMKGNICFGIKGKLRPRYIGPNLITTWIGSLAYHLQLPKCFMLRKYTRVPELKIEADPIIIQQDMTIDS